MLIAQYKKGLAAFEGQKKKDKKDFCSGGVWTHNIEGKRFLSGALASVATADI